MGRNHTNNNNKLKPLPLRYRLLFHRYSLCHMVSARAYGISCERVIYIVCIWSLVCPSPKFDHDKMCKMLSTVFQKRKRDGQSGAGEMETKEINERKLTNYWSRIKLRLIHHTSARCFIDYSIKQTESNQELSSSVCLLCRRIISLLGANFGNVMEFRAFTAAAIELTTLNSPKA